MKHLPSINVDYVVIIIRNLSVCLKDIFRRLHHDSAIKYQTSYLDKVNGSFKFFIWKVLSRHIAVYTGGGRPFARVPHGCTCWNILKFVFVCCVREHIRACRHITVTMRPYCVFTSIELRDRRFTTLEVEKGSDVSQEIVIYISLFLGTPDLVLCV